MAHKFESGLFFGESAWHGLGVTLPKDSPARQDIDAAITTAGLNWEVETIPLYTAAVNRQIATGSAQKVESFQAVRRKDTGSVLGIVGERYHVLQNREQFDWFKPFLDSGECSFETCGALAGGTLVWVLARINRRELEIAKGDKVRKYLLLSSSHDGTKATSVGFCPIRVVCWNTLTAALEDGVSKLLKVKHHSKQRDALTTIRDTVNLIDEQFEATAEQYRKLAVCRIDANDLRRYVKLVLEMPLEEKASSTRQLNICEKIISFGTSGAGQVGKALTAWGAYNGVTQYITHVAGNTAETRLKSAWYGPGRVMSKRALTLAMSLAG